MDKLVSIIMPVYNSAKYLNKAVDSLLNQNYKNIEILLIDDGSTDGSEKICDSYKADSRIKVFHKINEGVSATRNFGLSKCNGDYIVFVDDDDWVEENYIRLFIENIEDKELCVCGFFKNNKKVEYPILKKTINRIDYLKNMAEENQYGGYLWNRMYTRKILINNNEKKLFDENINIQEDYLFNLKVAEKIEYVNIVGEATYHYRLNDDSATNSISKSKDTTIMIALNIIIKSYIKERLDNQALFFEAIYLIEYQRAKYEFGKKIDNTEFKVYKKNLSKILNSINNRKMRKKIIFIIACPRIYYFLKKMKGKN